MTQYILPPSGGSADQTKLHLPDGTVIVGGAGDDTITVANGIAEPEGGNNTATGTTSVSQIAYWSSPTGIVANLQAGVVSNGYGGTDHISGFSQIAGSAYGDVFTGTHGNDVFYGSGGNDTYEGNGGLDKVQYYGQQSSTATVTYNVTTNTWTVVKNFSNGTTGTDQIHNVAMIQFDDKTYYSPGLTPITAPNSNGASVSQIVPVTVGNNSYLLLTWNTGAGTSSNPIQILQYDPVSGKYADNTQNLIAGVAPSLVNARNVLVTDLNGDGFSDILIANQGLDSSPFPGTHDTLLLSNGQGKWVDASNTLPTSLAFAHDVSSGVVASGVKGVFVNNIYSQAGTTPYYLMFDGQGHATNVSSSYLPATMQNFNSPYTSSLLTDLNGDGLADLVVGAEDHTQGPSYVYINPGNGDFSHVTPKILPPSPLPASSGLYSGQLQGPTTLDIQSIHLTSQAYSDLVVISTNGNYTGYAIQILINDGSGNFTDQSGYRLVGAPNQQLYSSGQPWLVRSFVLDVNGDGAPDIVTEGTNGVPSMIFENDGTGRLHLVYQTSGTNQIESVATPGGKPTLVEFDSQNPSFLQMVSVVAPPTISPGLPTTVLESGQAASIALPVNHFSNPGGGALYYSATMADGSALPSWLHFDANTATFSGNAPATTQNLNLTVQVSNSTGFFNTSNVALNVVADPGQSMTAPGAVPNGTHIQIADSAANVASNIDGLETLASNGQLSAISLTNTGTPTLAITNAQFSKDAGVLQALSGAYNLAVSGVTVAGLSALTQAAHVAAIGVSDTAANLSSNLDALQALVQSGKITNIAASDLGTVVATQGQFISDSAALSALTGFYSVGVSVSASNSNINAVSGHPTEVLLQGNASQYTLASVGAGNITATSGANVEHLNGLLQVQFSDQTVTLAQNNSNNERIALLYQAALGRSPDLTGLGYWEGIGNSLPAATQALGAYGLSDASGNYNGNLSVADGFTSSAEFASKYGALNNTQFVTQLYANVLDRAPDAAGLAGWVSQLNGGTSRAHVLIGFAESPEAISNAANGFIGQSGHHAAWLFLT